MLDFSAADQVRTVGKVCLCGVGSAGTKVMEEALRLTPQGVSVCAMNPDARLLNASTIPGKVHLGARLTRGLGTGGDAKVGRDAALESEAAILRAVEGASLVVIAAGLGGGTGSGVAPEVARLAKECGACVVSVIVRPFRFEGERRLATADEALRSLSLYSDMVLRFDNDAMDALIDADKGVLEAFSTVNAQLARAVMIVPGLLESTGGLLQVGLDDLMAVVGAGRGVCSFGMTVAAPDEDVASVLDRLAKSPLFLEKRPSETADALVLIRGNDRLSLARMEALAQGVYDMLGSRVRLHLGASVSKEAGDEVSITVLAVTPCGEAAEAAPAPAVTPPAAVVAPDDSPLAAAVPAPVAAPHSEPGSPPVTEPSPAPVQPPVEEAEISTPAPSPAPFLTEEDELEEVAEPAPAQPLAPAPAETEAEPQTTSSAPAPEQETEKSPEPGETEEMPAVEQEPDADDLTPEVAVSITDLSEGEPPAEGEADNHAERGMFAGVSPILFDGEDLDLPPALRKKKQEQE